MEIQIGEYKCPKCGKTFEDSVRGYVPGKLCRDCLRIAMQINQYERQLLEEDFSIEQTDEKITLQIRQLLFREGAVPTEEGEKLLTGLTEKLLKDDKRRKKIIKEILKLQRKKR